MTCAMARHMLVAALLTTHSCHALRQPPRMQAIHRRATAAPALAFLAALATPAATALPPPEGCKWTGEGAISRRITLSTQPSPLDARRRIPRPQVRHGRQAHQRELGLQRELREGLRRVRIHRHAGHPWTGSSTSEHKQGIIYVLSGSAAAPAASAPSTAAAPRTSCASGTCPGIPDSARPTSARRPRT